MYKSIHVNVLLELGCHSSIKKVKENHPCYFTNKIKLLKKTILDYG